MKRGISINFSDVSGVSVMGRDKEIISKWADLTNYLSNVLSALKKKSGSISLQTSKKNEEIHDLLIKKVDDLFYFSRKDVSENQLCAINDLKGKLYKELKKAIADTRSLLSPKDIFSEITTECIEGLSDPTLRLLLNSRKNEPSKNVKKSKTKHLKRLSSERSYLLSQQDALSTDILSFEDDIKHFLANFLRENTHKKEISGDSSDCLEINSLRSSAAELLSEYDLNISSDSEYPDISSLLETFDSTIFYLISKIRDQIMSCDPKIFCTPIKKTPNNRNMLFGITGFLLFLLLISPMLFSKKNASVDQQKSLPTYDPTSEKVTPSSAPILMPSMTDDSNIGIFIDFVNGPGLRKTTSYFVGFIDDSGNKNFTVNFDGDGPKDRSLEKSIRRFLPKNIANLEIRQKLVLHENPNVKASYVLFDIGSTTYIVTPLNEGMVFVEHNSPERNPSDRKYKFRKYMVFKKKSDGSLYEHYCTFSPKNVISSGEKGGPYVLFVSKENLHPFNVYLTSGDNMDSDNTNMTTLLSMIRALSTK